MDPSVLGFSRKRRFASLSVAFLGNWRSGAACDSVGGLLGHVPDTTSSWFWAGRRDFGDGAGGWFFLSGPDSRSVVSGLVGRALSLSLSLPLRPSAVVLADDARF